MPSITSSHHAGLGSRASTNRRSKTGLGSSMITLGAPDDILLEVFSTPRA